MKELANNSGDANKPQMYFDKEVDEFLDMIQEFRMWYAKPMTVSSCFRQAEYNRKVGGASNSLHLQAKALDWKVSLTSAQLKNVQHKWAEICLAHKRIGGINLYSWGVHLDAFEDKFGAKSFVVRDKR